MIKRIIVAGCRNYDNYDQAKAYIDLCIKEIKLKYKLIFISGCCSGADALGERYAKENHYDLERYPAEWEIYGKFAGPKRNQDMAKISDFVICF